MNNKILANSNLKKRISFYKKRDGINMKDQNSLIQDNFNLIYNSDNFDKYKEYVSKESIDINNPIVFDFIVSIFWKDPIRRHDIDKYLLTKALKDLYFFQSISQNIQPEAIDEVISNLKIKKLDKREILFRIGSIIIHKGDIGDNFYIILRGSVLLLIKNIHQHVSEGSATESSFSLI